MCCIAQHKFVCERAIGLAGGAAYDTILLWSSIPGTTITLQTAYSENDLVAEQKDSLNCDEEALSQ